MSKKVKLCEMCKKELPEDQEECFITFTEEMRSFKACRDCLILANKANYELENFWMLFEFQKSRDAIIELNKTIQEFIQQLDPIRVSSDEEPYRDVNAPEKVLVTEGYDDGYVPPKVRASNGEKLSAARGVLNAVQCRDPSYFLESIEPLVYMLIDDYRGET